MAPSDSVTGEVQPPGNTPDRGSVPVKEIVTGAVYQPVGLRGTESVITSLTVGAVSSILIGVTVAEPTLPALSVQEPDTDWLAPCVLTVVGGEQLAMPEVESIPVKVTVTEELFHPYVSGIGASVPPTTGGVVSRLIVTDCDAEPPAPVAEHVNVCPVVSVLTVAGPQPLVDVTGATLSTTDHVRETVLTYQPLFPRVPETCGVITGAAVSNVAVMVSEELGTTMTCIN